MISDPPPFTFPLQFTSEQVSTLVRALVDASVAWDKRADALLNERSSDRDSLHNQRLSQSAHVYRAHAKQARDLLLALQGLQSLGRASR